MTTSSVDIHTGQLICYWCGQVTCYWHIGFIPPAEAEANYYNQLDSTVQQAVLL